MNRWNALVREAFNAGNYCNAYVSDDLSKAWDAETQHDPYLSMHTSKWATKGYRDAFIVGFYSSYRRSEVPTKYRDEFESANASKAGQTCVMLGYVDDNVRPFRKELP